jgi:Zn ribbon nucleic-acid-binding protein
MNDTKICPFCGHEEYITYLGDTIDVGFGDNYQIAPDEYECLYCGFKSNERCENIEQLIKQYKKEIKKTIRVNLKWCSDMLKHL